MKKKIIFAVFVCIIQTLIFAVERSSTEWNNLVSRCAIDMTYISDDIQKIDMLSQPIFAADVIKAIIAFPNMQKQDLNIKIAAKELTANALQESKLAVKAAILEVIPKHMNYEIDMILNNICYKNMPHINIVHGISGNSDIMAALMSNLNSPTNMQMHTSIFSLPTAIGASYPQSDIGLLRVPRPLQKNDRKHHDNHPQPYYGQ